MATKIQTFRKDPNAVLDYVIDWGTNYLASDETISTATWTEGTGITKDSDSKTDTTTTIWLSGGTAGTGGVAGIGYGTGINGSAGNNGNTGTAGTKIELSI